MAKQLNEINGDDGKVVKKISCPVKLNLTLRVLDKNKDNFHEIFTVFLKKNGREELTISPRFDENIGDYIEMRGEQINTVNIVARALDFARRKNRGIPPLRVLIDKRYPVGSGIGAGSGNAAAMLRWLAEEYDLEADALEISKLGADVAFLAADGDLALAEGIGDVMSWLDSVGDYSAVLVFPLWATATAAAYEKLDALRAEGLAAMLSPAECRAEAMAVINKLRSGQKPGLLPNDFLETYPDERRADYGEAFDIFSGAGALAWGLCGSGSAVFALFGDGFDAEPVMKQIESLCWVKKTAELE